MAALNRSVLLGAGAAIGLLIQIALGFALASDHSLFGTLVAPHVAIGAVGLALVAYLAWRAFSWAGAGVKALYAATLVLVLAQVALGLEVLTAGGYRLVVGHEANAFAILVLLGLTEALASRERRKGGAKAAAEGVAAHGG